MTEKRFERIYADVDVFCRDHNAKGVNQLIGRVDYDRIVNLLNDVYDENQELKKKNKQLSIDFMDFKMKLIEQLQIHYDYASEQRQKNICNPFIAKSYEIICCVVWELAEEMGVDLE